MTLRLRQFLALLVLLLAAACTDGPTSPHPRSAGDADPSLALAPVVIRVCQFGGTYPNCYDEPSPPPPSDGTCTSYSTYQCGGGDAGVGGGGTAPPPATEPTCNPYTDKKCYHPLTTNDRDMIASVTKEYWRPLSAIGDAAARQQCQYMQEAFNKLLSAGSVYRGGYDTQNGDGSGTVPHYGAYYSATKTMHYDPSYLDSAIAGDQAARRQIAKTSLSRGCAFPWTRSQRT